MIELFDQICARIFPSFLREWIYEHKDSLSWIEYSYCTEINKMPIRLYCILGTETFAESLRNVTTGEDND